MLNTSEHTPPNDMPTYEEFARMSLHELAAWHEEFVGYDPVDDDPSIELETLRENCRELALIENCGGLDTDAYHRVEALRRWPPFQGAPADWDVSCYGQFDQSDVDGFVVRSLAFSGLRTALLSDDELFAEYLALRSGVTGRLAEVERLHNSAIAQRSAIEPDDDCAIEHGVSAQLRLTPRTLVTGQSTSLYNVSFPGLDGAQTQTLLVTAAMLACAFELAFAEVSATFPGSDEAAGAAFVDA